MVNVIPTYKTHPGTLQNVGNCTMASEGEHRPEVAGVGSPYNPPTYRPETQLGHPSARLDAFCQMEERKRKRE